MTTPAPQPSPPSTRRVVSMKDVAAAAGVSVSTVSKVINRARGNTRVSSAVRARVLKTSEELGYIYNEWARNLVQQRSSHLLFVLLDVADDLESPFYVQILLGFLDQCGARDYSSLVKYFDKSLMEGGKFEQYIARVQPSGVVVTGDVHNEHLHSLSSRNIPYTVIGNLDLRKPQAIIRADCYEAGRKATAFLLDRGYDVVHLDTCATSVASIDQDMLRGHVAELKSRGLAVSAVGWRDMAERRDLVTKAINNALNGSSRTGFVTLNDRGGLSLYHECEKCGCSIGDQIGIVSIGNSVLAAHSTPGLTSVDFRFRWMGAKSVDILLSRTDDYAASAMYVDTIGEVIDRGSA